MRTTQQQPFIILIKESALGSIVKDIFTYGGLIAVISVGIYFESSALQWIAGIMFLIAALGWAAMRKGQRHLTPQEAVNRLFREYAVTPQTWKE